MNNADALIGEKMSVSQYPNANEKAVEQLMDLIVQLIPDPNPDPGLEADIELAVCAHICTAFEQILKMPGIQILDPTLITQMKSTLRSCT